MGDFITEEPQSPLKIFSSALKDAFVQCNGFCVRSPFSSSSSDEETLISDIDERQIILSEIRNRAMKAKLRTRGSSTMESLCWVLSSVLPIEEQNRGGEGDNDDDDDEEAEDFFSVRSHLSSFPSESKFVGDAEESSRKQSVIEEFRNCEGWPFGLCRRAVLLPPLPSSPSDSWTWRRRTRTMKMG
ncbi:hypothetical protein QJS04_geneDACA021722 [Acorus gramineus]|uniref:Uncharacterized protein n=1 Tax=Acorus gramineus TaxID=55184 RepID=A0AAV9AJX3_ACOGR|nr:hypothetical protein QJS04_geneDACA021722 [Acorus gramineus]